MKTRYSIPATAVAAVIRMSAAPPRRRAPGASPAPSARDTMAAPPTVTPMLTEVTVNSVMDPSPTAARIASSPSVPRYSSDRNSTANTASMLAQPVSTISTTCPRSGPWTKRACSGTAGAWAWLALDKAQRRAGLARSCSRRSIAAG